jgi:hypothetical protein
MRAHDLVRHMAEVHGLPRREAVSRASDASGTSGSARSASGPSARCRPAAPTGEAGRRLRPRPRAAAPRRADQRPRPRPAGRDAGPGAPHRHGVRHRRRALSHLLEEVERVCDAVVILADGVVAASGTLASLRTGEDVVVWTSSATPRRFVAALGRLGTALEVAAAGSSRRPPRHPAHRSRTTTPFRTRRWRPAPRRAGCSARSRRSWRSSCRQRRGAARRSGTADGATDRDAARLGSRRRPCTR